jgi:exosortase
MENSLSKIVLLVRSNLLLFLGICAIFVPTMTGIIKYGWSTEAGTHGPIVFSMGIWLFVRQWPGLVKTIDRKSLIVSIILFSLFSVFYFFSQILDIGELVGYSMYGIFLSIIISFVGVDGIKKLIFPLFYTLFAFPVPESVIVSLTQPLKLMISQLSVGILYFFGYPIAGSGVAIQIGQYQLMVAAACSGLNSIVSLSAISIFYIYVRRMGDWKYLALMAALVLPVAVFANFVRVMVLILLTYYAGEATAQGFFHDFSGLSLFVIAVLTIFAIDEALYPLWKKIGERRAWAK